jgi:transcriptional regulator with XRE-family HTH domain
MGISATYLSRVENLVDPPSADLIRKMSLLYNFSLETLTAAAKKPALGSQIRGDAIASQENLRALYRLGIELSVENVEDFLREFLRKRFPNDEDQVERELLRLRQELPRMAASEGLLASDIKPRYLSKRSIASIAYETLEGCGLGPTNYVPPTPIEQIVDRQDGIRYSIADLPSRLVLGLTKWNVFGEREILISSTLDCSQGTNSQRFNFTLGHELFHALEHLPLAQRSTVRTSLNRIMLIEREPAAKRSPAQRSVERWTTVKKPGTLVTSEDWREWQANTFASCILMPEWAVRREFCKRIAAEYIGVSSCRNVREEALQIAGELLFDDVFHDTSLADLFGVSRQAMAIRLLDLGLVQEVEVNG